MAGKLTVADVRKALREGKPGRHADGGNLYLAVTGADAAKWTLRFMLAGKAREMGLGACDPEGKAGRTLAQARDAADTARKLLREGKDPVEHRKAEARAEAERSGQARSFRAVAEEVIGAHKAGWRSAKHAAQWGSTLEAWVYPLIGKSPVASITTDDVLRVLRQEVGAGDGRKPFWTARPETASRVRGRIEAVLSYATARGWRSGENPARWRGHLQTMLPARGKVATVKHHAALPWQELGTFMATLRGHDATARRALEFAILTASRTGEALGTLWSEIDMKGATWTIPGARMKAGRDHRVPLSSGALAVLEAMKPLRPKGADGYVFPGQKKDKPLSSMALLMLLRRMGRADLTAHGFRSSFRDWGAEATATPHAVLEAALAHTVGDKTVAAYARGDLFAKRAALMQAWSEHCGKAPAAIVSLRPRDNADNGDKRAG